MKKYFVLRGRFYNEYFLIWADGPEMERKLPAGVERISRKEAERLAAAENYRRKYDIAFSGYADNLIYPAGSSLEFIPGEDTNYKKFGYILEPIDINHNK